MNVREVRIFARLWFALRRICRTIAVGFARASIDRSQTGPPGARDGLMNDACSGGMEVGNHNRSESEDPAKGDVGSDGPSVDDHQDYLLKVRYTDLISSVSGTDTVIDITLKAHHIDDLNLLEDSPGIAGTDTAGTPIENVSDLQ
jgi:hypothetical protein